MRVPVVFGRISISRPFVRDPHPASEPDLAIDDQQLSMGAVVQLLSAGPVIQLEVMKLDDLRTSVAHLFYVLLIDLVGANGIAMLDTVRMLGRLVVGTTEGRKNHNDQDKAVPGVHKPLLTL